MAIATYSDLQNQIKSFLHRASLLDAVNTDNVPTLISLAEARINREVRSRLQEQRETTTVSGTYITLPSDFLAVRALFVSADPVIRLKYMQPEDLLASYPNSATETGAYYTIIGDEVRFGPPLASGTALELWYYKRLGALSSSAHTLFTSNPDLYLYCSLSTASMFVKDDKRIVQWEAIYANIRDQVNSAEREGRYGNTMEPRIG